MRWLLVSLLVGLLVGFQEFWVTEFRVLGYRVLKFWVTEFSTRVLGYNGAGF